MASSLLRCQECKETFDDPTTGQVWPESVDVTCPGCGHRTMRMFYIRLPVEEPVKKESET
jgi:DNA-directed RNA polymerase subunit RPC12/RpoP